MRIFHLLCHFSMHFYLCFWKYFEEMATWSCVISTDICHYIQVYSSFIVRNRDKTLQNFSWKYIIPTSRCKSGTKTKHGHAEFVGLVLYRWDSLNKARKKGALWYSYGNQPLKFQFHNVSSLDGGTNSLMLGDKTVYTHMKG